MPLTVVNVRRRFNSGTLANRLARNAKIAYYARSFQADPTPLSVNVSTIAGRAFGAFHYPEPAKCCAVFVLHEDRIQMANTAQARKRARQAEATRQRNASQKSALRTAVKKVKKAIAAGDKAAATATFHESQAVIDRIADKRIVHKNLASRTKSRLAQAIRALA
jgi:small subunit ribosomal protein S20